VISQTANRFYSNRSNFLSNFFFDPVILVLGVGLVLFSLVMVYSTTGIIADEKFGDAFFYVKRQGVSVVIGFILMFLATRVSASFLQKISPYCYFFCLLCLIVTLIPGIGDSAGGAQRWIDLKFVRFQPGEFVKLSFTIFAAGYFSRYEDRLVNFKEGIIKPMVFTSIICGLFLLQPDFGSCVIIFTVMLGMALVSGVRLMHLGACFMAGAIAAGFLVLVSPYRMKRLVSFLDPFADPAGKGYQLIQSLIAIGSGQATGVGLGGSQQKLFFLPAAHTDFIFAVISEELGFIGAVVTLIPFLILLWRGLKLSRWVIEDTFSFSLIVGLILLIIVPAMLNVGVVTGLLPTKGMVLPLIGYGGSSLVMCLVTLGLVQALLKDKAQ